MSSLLLLRTVRRVKGWFWSVWYAFLVPFKWLRFKRTMRQNGLSEKYLWKAFTYLASLDMDEPMRAGDIELLGCGMYVDVKDTSREFHATLQQNWKRQLVVFLWRTEKRKAMMEYGMEVETNWWEIYRSGRHVSPSELARVYLVLKQLYGDGPRSNDGV